jgi:hypothetical protein
MLAHIGHSMTEAAEPAGTGAHPGELHQAGVASRPIWLRAGVLGANDAILSTAGLVVGVADASTSRAPILTAGVAGLVAGAVAIALGEFVPFRNDTGAPLYAAAHGDLGSASLRSWSPIGTPGGVWLAPFECVKSAESD